MIRYLLALSCVLWLRPATVLAGQEPTPALQPGRQGQAGDLSPAEVQRLFDAYALVQAQEALSLSDDQYAKFVTSMKTLQETRRRSQQERLRLLRELARLTGPEAPPPDDQAVTSMLTTLKQQDAKAAAELQKAYDGVDQVLTIRQRARFRLFEENMERRKIELLMRARQQRRESAPIRRELPD
jgi:hypothetical protein